MTHMVTRCPKCATAFRITSTQLDSAKGAVRCGSCLHIFKAPDHLVKSITETETPIAATPTPTILSPEITPAVVIAPNNITNTINEQPLDTKKVVIDKAKILEDEDDILISDDMDKVEDKNSYEFDGFIDMDMHPKQTVSLFEREIRYEPEEDAPEPTDESWAEELLDDDEETLHQLKRPTSPLAPAETKAEPEKKLEPEEAETNTTSPETSQETKYSAPVFSLVSETTNNDDLVFSSEFLHATQAQDDTAIKQKAADFAAALFTQSPPADEEAQSLPAKRVVKSSSKMRAFDTSRAALLMNIMPAPVEFTAKRMRRWYQQKLWPTLALLMTLLLLFQVAYFKFPYFSRVEPYRTAYVFICPLVGCKVPALIDTRKIHATNLIVRNHPTAKNALIVDAILINEAPFEQPYPDLLLEFRTLDNTPVAGHRFTPAEYLNGEEAGKDHIVQHQPVHITLEITDPGPEAVNYDLSIP